MVVREPDIEELVNQGRSNERWHSQRRFGDCALRVIWAQRDDGVVAWCHVVDVNSVERKATNAIKFDRTMTISASTAPGEILIITVATDEIEQCETIEPTLAVIDLDADERVLGIEVVDQSKSTWMRSRRSMKLRCSCPRSVPRSWKPSPAHRRRRLGCGDARVA